MPKSLVDVAELEALVAPVCAESGVALVETRLAREPEGKVLRVLIEPLDAHTLPPRSGGVTLEDCTRVSRALSRLLDADESLIEGEYRLEVSSPGVERPLTKPIDYAHYAGREARVATNKPHEGRKSFTGTLLGLQGDDVLLRDSGGEEIALPFREIGKAHLVFRF
ncbi:MAG: ribosome maturation factor RimP [Polyangiales bacterium]